ncbi:MAG TPA: helix-hairpin-helix domain-containing protein [Verrucomicrobiae bacterium]|jgi:competence ComEA-like helix-hairpin-helix protein
MTTLGRNERHDGSGFWPWLLAGFLTLAPLLAPAQLRKDAEHPLGNWEVLDGCRLLTNAPMDGDSFHVLHRGRDYLVRLYFVDAPETDASLRERIEDQAEYFGIAVADVPRGGILATKLTREKLTGREFTVVTRWQNAMGRSRQARFYGIVLVHGKSLADELVSNGLARIYGLRANWPETTRSATIINKLKNLEMTAREQGRGLWDLKAFAHSTPGASKASELKGGKSGLKTVDINEASFEELQKLPGIGPVTAQGIMAHRPYKQVDDLLKVPGLGLRSIEKFRSRVLVEGVENEK